MQFQSTLSVRRATFSGLNHTKLLRISIHALRKESDLRQFQHKRLHIISIHALRKESDERMMALPTCTPVFQSTLSVRRATRG